MSAIDYVMVASGDAGLLPVCRPWPERLELEALNFGGRSLEGVSERGVEAYGGGSTRVRHFGKGMNNARDPVYLGALSFYNIT